MPIRKASTEDLGYISSSIYYNINNINRYTDIEDVIKYYDNILKLKNPEWISKSRFARGHFWKSTTPEWLYFYERTETELIVPRNFPHPDLIPYSISDKRIEGEDVSYNCLIALRDYQEKYLADNPKILSHDDKVLEMGCGTGKTILAIYLAHYYRKVTLILVPTYYLAEQWYDRISETTAAKIYEMKPTDKHIPLDADFYICSMELFSARMFDKSFTDRIGHVVMDEAHRMGAQTYMPILQQIPARKRTALTATFRRADGMHMILGTHFGEVFTCHHKFPLPKTFPVFMETEVHDSFIKKDVKAQTAIDWITDNCDVKETKGMINFDGEAALEKLKLHLEHEQITKKDYAKIITPIKKSLEPSFTHLYSYLSQDARRNKKCIKIIQQALDKGRTILFLSKRKEVLKSLAVHFKDYDPIVVLGKANKEAQLNRKQKIHLKKTCRLIFGIEQLAKEGLDIDRLDTLIIHLPIKDTEQAAGRIARWLPDKKPAVVLYLLDKCSQSLGIFNASKKYLKINTTVQTGIAWKNVEHIL